MSLSRSTSSDSVSDLVEVEKVTPPCLQDGLMEAINHLQQVCKETSVTTDLKLPSIVVIGEQSIGKSSVLESIIGLTILPRGTGIVTRCPILVNLHKVDNDDEQKVTVTLRGEKSAEFKITESVQIQQAIEDITTELAPNKAISNKAISVNIYSTTVVSLSFVDLPGITKNPVGDQPQDIGQQTEELVRSYVKDSNTIILAVAPANIDIANSESIKIARDVDPEFDKTLAVITKLDLMDKGTDAMDVLTGETYAVKLGLVGVKCCSQHDIEQNKPIKQVVEDEEKFLVENYKSIAHEHGTRYLAGRLRSLLMMQIEKNLPDILSAIGKKIAECKAQIDLLGEPVEDNDIQKIALSFIHSFPELFDHTIRGNAGNIDSVEIVGGAKLYEVFFNTLPTMFANLKKKGRPTLVEINQTSKNAMGGESHAFVPRLAYEVFARRDIETLRAPCMKATELVRETLDSIIKDILLDKKNILSYSKYPKFVEVIRKIASEVLDSQAVKSNRRIENLICEEKGYINMNHPDMIPFFNVSKPQENGEIPIPVKVVTDPKCLKPPSTFSFGEPPGAMAQNKIERLGHDPHYIYRMINEYFDVGIKTVLDRVTKIFWLNMVLNTVEALKTELIVWYAENHSKLKLFFKEKGNVNQRRKVNKDLLKDLVNAQKVIAKISDRKMME